MNCPPEVPVTGQRKRVKIFGAIELWDVRFEYRQDTVSNAEDYLVFLEQLAQRYRRQGAILIQVKKVWSWFNSNQHWLEVHQLPPTHQSSIPPNGSGSIRERTERTIDSSAEWMPCLPRSHASLRKCSRIHN